MQQRWLDTPYGKNQLFLGAQNLRSVAQKSAVTIGLALIEADQLDLAWQAGRKPPVRHGRPNCFFPASLFFGSCYHN
jgi:hypothetical protein